MFNDIICISTHYWNDFWFRKQHFMSRFAKLGHRVLYVQPTFSMVRKNAKIEIAKNRMFLPLLEKQSENIYLFSPLRLFPKPQIPFSSALSHQRFGKLISKTAKKLCMNSPILWLYRPEYAAAVRHIPHKKLVFDLADDLSAYSDNFVYSAYVAKCVSRLSSQADLMVVTSPTLLDKYKKSTQKCLLVSNGFDENLFNGSQKPVPSDLKGIKRPVAGFVGVLFSFLDYELLYETAKGLPDVSFVFVGPTEKSGKKGVEKLKTLSNTHFLGRKAKEDIPGYVTNFDICLNPFKVDNVSRAVSPLKIYEYLACGKTVISTPMEGLARENAGKLITFINSDGFKEKIRESLNGLSFCSINRQHVDAAGEYSWSSRFNSLYKHLEIIL